MVHLNLLLAALFVTSAVSAPVHTDVVPCVPSSPVSTPVPTTVPLPVNRSVPSSVWQGDRHAVVRSLSTPVSAVPPFPDGDKAFHVRAAMKSVSAVTTVTLPLPTATAPRPHTHRADDGTDCDDAEVTVNFEKRDLHARMLAIPIKGLGRSRTTTTLNSIKIRQLFLPTVMFNAAPVPKATAA